MFGYAISLDISHIRVGILDHDGSGESRDFAGKFFNSRYFDYARVVEREDEFDRLMREERIGMGIVIPPDFSRNLQAGRPAEVQVLVDGSNSNTASAVLGYVQGIVREFEAGRRAGGVLPPLEIRPRILYNPELRSALFLVPGLIAIILVVTAVIATALSVVREKELGTMEQLVTSPLRAPELILGKIIPPFLVSLFVTGLTLLASRLLFGVTIRGSLIDLLLVTLLFLFGCLGLGLLLSTVAETQQVAFMIAVIVTFLPSFILSGFVFPIRNMPLPVQAVTYLIPARYFLSALRHVMVRGAGIDVFWKDALFLLIFVLLTFGGSIARLKKGRIG
jgi:ABC-2 type transport system permease protein